MSPLQKKKHIRNGPTSLSFIFCILLRQHPNADEVHSQSARRQECRRRLWPRVMGGSGSGGAPYWRKANGQAGDSRADNRCRRRSPVVAGYMYPDPPMLAFDVNLPNCPPPFSFFNAFSAVGLAGLSCPIQIAEWICFVWTILCFGYIEWVGTHRSAYLSTNPISSL